MKSLDEHIAAVVEKATQKAMDKILKSLDEKVSKIIEKHMTEKETMQSMGGTETLITVKEASKALGINQSKVQELIKEGEIRMVNPPGCRGKIIQSSINSYIKRLQEKAV